MRRLLAIFGAVLMVIAFVILTIFIIAPSAIMPLDNAPLLKDILQIVACRPNEELTAGYSTYETPGTTSTSIDFNCVDSQQTVRDVGQQIIQIGGIGYLVLFLTGLFMFLFGMQDANKQRNVPSAALRREKLSSENTLFTPSEQAHTQAPDQPEHLPLAQRLQELKEAFNAGLITEAEYKSKRMELLNQD